MEDRRQSEQDGLLKEILEHELTVPMPQQQRCSCIFQELSLLLSCGAIRPLHAVRSVKWSGVEWSEVKWSEVEWSGVKWSGVKWSGVKWSEVKWSEVKWSEVELSEVELSEVEWSGVKWSGVKWIHICHLDQPLCISYYTSISCDATSCYSVPYRGRVRLLALAVSV